MKKILSLVLALAMILSVVAVAGAESTTLLPRNETLYFSGWQYGSINGYNPLSSNMNNGFFSAKSDGSRTSMFESLYMYNMLDGKCYPLLADGDYVWNDDLTQLTVKIKPAAKWSDGTPVTAEDVAKTWEVSVKYQNAYFTSFGPYIKSVEAVDGAVVVTLVTNEEGKPLNPLFVIDYLTGTYVAQAAWLDAMVAKYGDDADGFMNDACADAPYSGPYGPYIANESILAMVRNDEYWGKDETMWGKLPAPKYIAHTIYADNNAALVGLKAGDVDVSQQFISNVQDLWEKEDLPISTYMDEVPYGICAQIPSAWFNMEIEVLQVREVRKAIALAVDYDSIIENAMTNQSPSFADVPRSVMNPTDGEQALYDHEAVKDLQWVGKQYDEAKALLDSVGIVDSDGDGWREYNGEKISLNACCPYGWSDWQAAMEIVAAAGKEIGIDISTNYPEWDVYQTVFTAASQTEYDIFMWSGSGAQPSNPWGRVRMFMSSEFIGVNNNWSGNFGHWTNERADEIIAAIPLTTDEAELKALYTEATEIYLTEVPSFSLMYRPNQFHAVNESVWTGFPEAGDGLNIPPTDCLDGYGIAALYHIELVEE